MSLTTVYNLKPSIGVSESNGTWTYADLSAGIDNISESLNEVVQQYFFLADNGFAKNHVTGMAPSFTLTGRRIAGDAAQDFIFDNKYKLDTDRESSFKLEATEGNTTVTVVCACTICNVQEWSGASTDDSAISFELRLNGEPTVTSA